MFRFWNWLIWLWRLRSPMICHCKLETQESQWSNWVRIWWSVNQGSQWCRSQARSKGPTVGSNKVSSSSNLKSQEQECWCPGVGKMDVQVNKKNQIHPSSIILVYEGAHWLGWCPLHCWGESSLLSLLIQMLKCPYTDTARNNILPTTWAQ